MRRKRKTYIYPSQMEKIMDYCINHVEMTPLEVWLGTGHVKRYFRVRRVNKLIEQLPFMYKFQKEDDQEVWRNAHCYVQTARGLELPKENSSPEAALS